MAIELLVDNRKLPSRLIDVLKRVPKPGFVCESFADSIRKVVQRLRHGDDLLVPMFGGYWLPGELAVTPPRESAWWACKSNMEFNTIVSPDLIQALRNPGALDRDDEVNEKRFADWKEYAYRLGPAARGPNEHP